MYDAAHYFPHVFRASTQAKKFMDECTADCPNEKTLKRRNLTEEQWWKQKLANIKVKRGESTETPRFFSLSWLRHIIQCRCEKTQPA